MRGLDLCSVVLAGTGIYPEADPSYVRAGTLEVGRSGVMSRLYLQLALVVAQRTPVLGLSEDKSGCSWGGAQQAI